MATWDTPTRLVFTDTEQPSLARSNSSLMNFWFLPAALPVCYRPELAEVCATYPVFTYGIFGQKTVLVFTNLAMFASMACESLLKNKTTFSTLKLYF